MGYLCHICFKIYSTKFVLDRHITSAHMEHKHPCPRCNTSYSRKADLNTHALEEHGIKLIWKTVLTGSLVYARELVLLDDGGILLQGPNPRYLFRHEDPESIKMKSGTPVPPGAVRNQFYSRHHQPESVSTITQPPALTANQLAQSTDHRPIDT